MNQKMAYIITLLLLLSTSIFSLGERPDWDTVRNKAKNKVGGGGGQIVYAYSPTANQPTLEAYGLTEDDVKELKKTYYSQVEKRQFPEALETITKIPDFVLTSKETISKAMLKAIDKVNNTVETKSNLLSSGDELDEATKMMIEKLYNESQYQLVAGDRELARDLLIHIIYLHRRNFNAKKLLDTALGLDTGDYKVANMENQYWSNSEVFFYGGNYEKALAALDVLTLFDKKNPIIFERKGSSYYMLNQKKEAKDAWSTALFLDPTKKELEEIINKTENYMEEDKIKAQIRKEQRNQRESQSQVPEGETQLLGVFPDQTKAYNYAQKLRQKGLTALVEELPNGKWTVKVPKSQMQNQ